MGELADKAGRGLGPCVLGTVVPGRMPGAVVPGGMPGAVVPGGMSGAVVPAGCLAWYQLYEPGVPRVQRLDPTSEKC